MANHLQLINIIVTIIIIIIIKFCAEIFVFPSSLKYIYLFIYLNTKKYNVACYFLRVWNLLCHIEGDHRLRVFVNRVLRRIFGPKLEE